MRRTRHPSILAVTAILLSDIIYRPHKIVTDFQKSIGEKHLMEIVQTFTM
jgi:tetrahydromethanopterin S-methyltransferase subunit H